MAENLQGDGAAVVTEQTCGICLGDSKDPLNLPCGHSFCDGCLDGWRSRYGADEEMRRKCPTCRASIPPSKEMVAALKSWRARKKKFEDENEIFSEHYHRICQLLASAEESVGKDWDGVTVLGGDNNGEPAVVMPGNVFMAIRKGDIKSILRWVNASRAEDRVNAVTSVELASMTMLMLASINAQLALMSLLLQLGADVDNRMNQGLTVLSIMFVSVVGKRGWK